MFRFKSQPKKKTQTPKGVWAFLVQEMGLETTLREQQVPDGSDTSVNAEKSDFMPFSALLFSG